MLINEILTEGLIAIPPKMKETIHRIVVKNILHWASSQFKQKAGDGKSFAAHMPEQYKAFRKLVAKYGYNIPNSKYTNDQVLGYYVPFDLSEIDPSYSKNADTDENIRFAILWNENALSSRTLAGWMPERKILFLRPKVLHYLMHYPTSRNDPDDLEIGLNQMLESVDHELRHVVQYMAIKHPDQTKMNADYDKHRDSYLASPVEFDPQIGSAVHEFLELWNTTNNRKSLDTKNLSKAMKQFVGSVPTQKFDAFAEAGLFKALKTKSPERYKIAVKKFVTEVGKKLLSEV